MTEQSLRQQVQKPPVQNPPIQNPLTLVMKAKCPDSAAALRKIVEHLQSLPQDQNPVVAALNSIGTVHFARFTFVEDDRLAVITTYDHELEKYLNEFVNEIGDIFNKLLAHVENAPPLPVQAHRQEFFDYVQAHDRRCVGLFYSAYPNHTAFDIRDLIESSV